MNGPPPGNDDFTRILNELLTELPDLLRRFADRDFPRGERFNDLVQDVAAAALASLDPSTFDPRDDLRDSLRAFLFRVAQNKYNDYKRNSKLGLKSLEDDVLKDAAIDKLTASRLVAKDQAEVALQECLFKLDAQDRHLLIRKYIDGLPAEAVAQEFDLTIYQLDHRLRQARAKLRTYLGSSGSVRFDINPG